MVCVALHISPFHLTFPAHTVLKERKQQCNPTMESLGCGVLWICMGRVGLGMLFLTVLVLSMIVYWLEEDNLSIMFLSTERTIIYSKVVCRAVAIVSPNLLKIWFCTVQSCCILYSMFGGCLDNKLAYICYMSKPHRPVFHGIREKITIKCYILGGCVIVSI